MFLFFGICTCLYLKYLKAFAISVGAVRPFKSSKFSESFLCEVSGTAPKNDVILRSPIFRHMSVHYPSPSNGTLLRLSHFADR